MQNFKHGQQFSTAIEGIDIAFSQLDWYSFPSEVQRILPPIMLITQQPNYIKCFGNVLCARKQFRKVSRNILFVQALRVKNIIMGIVCSFFRWLKWCTRTLRCFENFINKSGQVHQTQKTLLRIKFETNKSLVFKWYTRVWFTSIEYLYYSHFSKA